MSAERVTSRMEYSPSASAPAWVHRSILSHRVDGVDIPEDVVRVRLSSRLRLVLHGSSLGSPVTFNRLDLEDDSESLPHWLDPERDPGAFYASWRHAAPHVWPGPMGEADVHVFARGAITPEWWMLYYCGASPDVFIQEPYPGPLAFRGFAWAAKARVICIADAAETPESFGWLLCHELAHVAFARAPFLLHAFASDRARHALPEDVRYDDADHERDPEERAANDAATAIMDGCYDRLWWRARIRDVRMTLTHRVPAGVPAVSTLHAGALSSSSPEA